MHVPLALSEPRKPSLFLFFHMHTEIRLIRERHESFIRVSFAFSSPRKPLRTQNAFSPCLSIDKLRYDSSVRDMIRAFVCHSFLEQLESLLSYSFVFHALCQHLVVISRFLSLSVYLSLSINIHAHTRNIDLYYIMYIYIYIYV